MTHTANELLEERKAIESLLKVWVILFWHIWFYWSKFHWFMDKVINTIV
jgi:hypothetical protein